MEVYIAASILQPAVRCRIVFEASAPACCLIDLVNMALKYNIKLMNIFLKIRILRAAQHKGTVCVFVFCYPYRVAIFS